VLNRSVEPAFNRRPEPSEKMSPYLPTTYSLKAAEDLAALFSACPAGDERIGVLDHADHRVMIDEPAILGRLGLNRPSHSGLR